MKYTFSIFFIIFPMCMSFSLYGEKKALLVKPLHKPLEKASSFSKSNYPFYGGGNFGLSYQITDLELTENDEYLHLGLHPLVYEFFVGYKWWRLRLEASFLHRPMKTYNPRYDSQDGERKFLVIEYDVKLSTYHFALKLLYDVFNFRTYVNPFFGLGVAFAHTDLKHWRQTEKSGEGDIKLTILGKSTKNVVILGILGNTFPITDAIKMQFLFQFTFLQSIETHDKFVELLEKGRELNKDKAPPYDGIVVSSDFLIGFRYDL